MNKLNKFPERLKELRNQIPLTQKELGKFLNCKQSTIACWEGGTRQPNLDSLIKLCEILKTTSDYLIGRTNFE